MCRKASVYAGSGKNKKKNEKNEKTKKRKNFQKSVDKLW